MADSQRKTANLFDGTLLGGYYTSVNYSTSGDENVFKSIKVYLTAGTYTFSWGKNVNVVRMIIDGTYIQGGSTNISSYTFTSTTDDYVGVSFRDTTSSSTVWDVTTPIMLNEGQTALPYEPYGWKHSLRKLTTATEAVENPLYSDGTAITAYTLKGNTVQNGTPTPSNPVDVNGLGVRTENLFDLSTTTNEVINSNGSITPASAGDPYYLSEYISADNVTISVQYKETAAAEIFTVGVYDSSKSFIRRDVISNNSVSYENVAYIRINYRDKNCQNVMLNTGSTAKPYEPYGYKIPISSGGVTTNIYLGSTQTVRQIKKYEFTGNEQWTQSGARPAVCYTPWSAIGGTPYGHFYCDRTVEVESQWDLAYGKALSDNNLALWIFESAVTATEFKQYLAEQYANGTPVTVWYVLETPQTAVVNEPLMKIGDYADTLSNAAQIPTTEGANSITVDTTVQPSEFTATWTGWHDAEVKEKSENYLDENDFGLVEVAAGTYRDGTDVGVLPSGTYTLSANKSSSAVQIYRTTKNGSTYNYETITNLPYTFTADGVSNQIFRSAGNTGSSWADLGYTNVMLNTGETAQTYEPYWK